MHGKLADSGAIASGLAATSSWVVTANEYLQLIATCIAILAGAASLVYHVKRTRNIKHTKG